MTYINLGERCTIMLANYKYGSTIVVWPHEEGKHPNRLYNLEHSSPNQYSNVRPERVVLRNLCQGEAIVWYDTHLRVQTKMIDLQELHSILQK